ncbi:MAG TPA: sigma-70 family RNA polymerase sigma factor [Bacteroidota bacterium]|jgi:RNA polymerase sigma-70 factor (ECF subfamily)|nr:sigma-70 family RNA polymerase sigma factor [Bacteroidota bacterium]
MAVNESSHGPRTDLELVEDFRRGDVTGFNELVRRYQEKVYWIGRRVIGTHEDADDVVQDVFVRVYGALKGFRGESGFYTWLYKISMNVSLNALRKKRIKDFLRYDETEEELESDDEGPDSHVEQKEYETILQRAIERLPPKQKMVFMMRYYDEMPYEEMAKILNKSVGGLKANYFHALKKIQIYVKRESH